jgi:hypothetical protein
MMGVVEINQRGNLIVKGHKDYFKVLFTLFCFFFFDEKETKNQEKMIFSTFFQSFLIVLW